MRGRQKEKRRKKRCSVAEEDTIGTDRKQFRKNEGKERKKRCRVVEKIGKERSAKKG